LAFQGYIYRTRAVRDTYCGMWGVWA
jgi:hypothetical protein